MTWPFSNAARVTDGFDTPRPNGRHRAIDVADELGIPIVAPEPGGLFWLYMVRAGVPLPGLAESVQVLTHQAGPYRWYYADRYGACVVLVAAQRWWLFAHVDPFEAHDFFARRAVMTGLQKWRNARDASRFIECYSTVGDQPLPSVQEGEPIAYIGDSGYSTGPHTHMEVCPPGYAGGAPSRINPASLFPGRLEP